MSVDVERKTGYPLRITGGEKRKLVAPFEEVGSDTVTYEVLWVQGVVIGKVDLLDEAGTFKRSLLISEVPGKVVITMTGYEFTGPVEVQAWKTSSKFHLIEKGEREKLYLVNGTELEHVEGEEEAIARHSERLADLSPLYLSSERLEEIHRALWASVPSR